jgi:uncharacterized protein YdhG (YjbR/CyaY superfamily)
MNNSGSPKNIDDYIAEYQPYIQDKLNELRVIIKKVAPEAEEKISYGMPAFTFKGVLAYFAVHTKHIGLYHYPSAIEAFKKEASIYKTAKGSIQFPLDKPLPLDLISRIVAFRLNENIMKAELKALKKKDKRTRN